MNRGLVITISLVLAAVVIGLVAYFVNRTMKENQEEKKRVAEANRKMDIEVDKAAWLELFNAKK